MMIDNRAIKRVTLFSVIAPLLFAAGVRIVQPEPLPGPASASAETDAANSAEHAASKLKISDRQKAAAAFLETLPQDAPAQNVFIYPKVQEQRIDITPTPTTDPVLKTPDFELSSIMKTRRGDVALVNGRLRHIGDEVVADWFVVSIDPILRAVTIECVDGRTVTISMSSGLDREQ